VNSLSFSLLEKRRFILIKTLHHLSCQHVESFSELPLFLSLRKEGDLLSLKLFIVFFVSTTNEKSSLPISPSLCKRRVGLSFLFQHVESYSELPLFLPLKKEGDSFSLKLFIIFLVSATNKKSSLPTSPSLCKRRVGLS
jgi:hypothetical protein